jgi:hypothetical protein
VEGYFLAHSFDVTLELARLARVNNKECHISNNFKTLLKYYFSEVVVTINQRKFVFFL